MNTAEQHRAKAAECDQRAADSWERSDTDGFLSQWAGGLTADLHRMKAAIIENGGRWQFNGLYDGERRLAAKIVQNQYGHSWLLREDEAAKYGRKYVPVGDTSRIQRKMGLNERPEQDAAYAFMNGSGHGLSGSAWVDVARKNPESWGLDAEILNGGHASFADAGDTVSCMRGERGE